MRVLLRLVAGYTLWSLIGTLRMVVDFWQRGQIMALSRAGFLGSLTVILWVVLLLAGVPAAVLLWRMKRTGLFFTSFFWGCTGLYYVFGLIFFRTPQSHYVYMLFAVVSSAALVALVLSPRARRVCQLQQLPSGTAV